MAQINQYPNQAFSVRVDDLFDIDRPEKAGGYLSHKLQWADMVSTLGNSFIASCNTVTIKTQDDFPPNNILNLPNITYLICGEVEIDTPIDIQADGVAIIGLNPKNDKIKNLSENVTIEGTDRDVYLENLGFTGTLASFINVTNYTLAAPDNYGRTKKCRIYNCEILDMRQFGDIYGFDLVDLNNTIVENIRLQGLNFHICFHLEMASCEMYYFSDISSGVYNSLQLITLHPDIGASTFGVVNINNCIIHPEFGQDGIFIDDLATIPYGMITGNSLIREGLTTGSLLKANLELTNHLGIQVETNQGIANYKPKSSYTLTNNTTPTVLTTNNPNIVNGNSNFVFPSAAQTRVTTNSATGEVTYVQPRETNFFVSVNFTLEVTSGTNQAVTIHLAVNGSVIPDFQFQLELDQNIPQSGSFQLNGFATQNDTFALYVGNNTSTNSVIVQEINFHGFAF